MSLRFVVTTFICRQSIGGPICADLEYDQEDLSFTWVRCTSTLSFISLRATGKQSRQFIETTGPVVSLSSHGTVKSNQMNIRENATVTIGNNFLPIFSCFVTNATSHQMECTLSPGTCGPAVYNIQPGTQYSGVHPTSSSSLSQTGIRLLVLHLDHLTTRKLLKTR